MAVSLNEFSSFTPSEEQKEIIETVNGDSILLQALPFIDIDGMKYRIWREVDEDTSISYRAVNQGFQSGNGKIESEDHFLTLCGGHIDVDEAIVNSDINNMTEILLRQKMRSIGLKITRDLIYGNNSTNPSSIDGLYRKLARANDYYLGTGNLDLMGTTGYSAAQRSIAVAFGVNYADSGLSMSSAANRALLLRSINVAISRMPVLPDIMIMGSGVHVFLQDALNESSIVRVTLDKFGTSVPAYNGIPIFTLPKNPNGSEIIDFNEASPDGTNVDCSSILLIKFGSNQYYGGIRGQDLNISEPKLLDDNTTIRWTIKYNINHILYRYDSVIRIGGIRQ